MENDLPQASTEACEAVPTIAVSSNPLDEQLRVLLRQALLTIGGGLVTRGIVSKTDAGLIVGVLMIIIPGIIGQLATRLQATILARLAHNPAVPEVLPKKAEQTPESPGAQQ